MFCRAHISTSSRGKVTAKSNNVARIAVCILLVAQLVGSLAPVVLLYKSEEIIKAEPRMWMHSRGTPIGCFLLYSEALYHVGSRWKAMNRAASRVPMGIMELRDMERPRPATWKGRLNPQRGDCRI